MTFASSLVAAGRTLYSPAVVGYGTPELQSGVYFGLDGTQYYRPSAAVMTLNTPVDPLVPIPVEPAAGAIDVKLDLTLPIALVLFYLYLRAQ